MEFLRVYIYELIILEIWREFVYFKCRDVEGEMF